MLAWRLAGRVIIMAPDVRMLLIIEIHPFSHSHTGDYVQWLLVILVWKRQQCDHDWFYDFNFILIRTMQLT